MCVHLKKRIFFQGEYEGCRQKRLDWEHNEVKKGEYVDFFLDYILRQLDLF